MIKILRLILIGAIIIATTPVFAQTISGTVTDAGKPLPGASIRATPSNIGGSTDSLGRYSLSLKPGTYKIIFSEVGFEPQTLSVMLAAGESKTLNVALTASASALNEVVVVGSRGGGRSRLLSPVPVDVISVNSVNDNTAKPDLMSQLNQNVPSFNYNKQSGADGADAIDYASLRGLGFDQTLVLINGVRRHESAYVDPGEAARGRGESGTDLNAIPEAAIDHVEILRDGASAQYGSDAIAGVINIVLRKNVNLFTLNAGFSGYDDQKYNTLSYPDPKAYYTGKKFDGQTFTLGGDYGFSIGQNGGFFNIGGNFEASGKTLRMAPDLPISPARRAFGDGSVESGGAMYNMEIPIKGTNTTFYSFGGYNYKYSEVYAYTRTWPDTPDKFPTDQSGNLVFVPGIMRIDASDGAPYDPNNVYYNPEEDVYITDFSAAIGFKGKFDSGWSWNISNNTGRNDFHYYGQNTFNASTIYTAGQAPQTRFNDGGFNYLQNTTNADITKHFNHVAQGMQLSFGTEFRYERYQIYAGEPNSYNNGGAQYTVTGSQGQDSLANKAPGAEGYPGYQPSDAHIADRGSEAAYAESAIDLTKSWIIDVAGRFENYDDFGSVATGKFATLYKVTDNFNLRGSISSGFRAPSLQQENFSNTNTTVGSGGTLIFEKTVPNYSDIARSANIPKLTAEHSTNYSLGFTWQPFSNVTATVDAYQIDVRNRIVYSGIYGEGDPAFGDETVKGTLNYALLHGDVAEAAFFTNAVNTTNRGVDIVIDYRKRWENAHFNATLSGNLQDVIINKINIPAKFNQNPDDSATFFSDREQYFLKYAAPKAKFNLNLDYGFGKWDFGTRFTYFGLVKELGFGEASPPDGVADPYFPYVGLDNGNGVVPEVFVFNPKVTTDIYVSYKIRKNISWDLGIDNLFNVHPDEAVVKGATSATTGDSSLGDSNSGGAFESVQMGFNGMRIFTKLKWTF